MDLKTHAGKLYRQHGRRILGLLLKRNGGDLYAAEEVLHNTFVAFLKSYKTFRHKSSYFTWLCRIALNKLADYYRGQVNPKSNLSVALADPKASVEEQVVMQDLHYRLGQCLDLLPADYRRLLQLKYYEELSNREICVKLKIAPRSLEGKLYRAKKALAGIL